MFNPSTTTVDADEIAAAKPLMEMPVTSAIYAPRAGAVLWVPQALHIAALGALCVPLKLALRL